MSFLAELKRRNVIRMAGLYLVGAWLITQVAGTVLPMFGAPDWIARSIVIVLALGLIPAVIFSWVFELTPAGIRRDADVSPGESIAPQTARRPFSAIPGLQGTRTPAQRLDRTIIVVLLLALAYFGFDKFVLAPRRDASLIASIIPGGHTTANSPTDSNASAPKADAIDLKSIAVLPFTDLSPAHDQEYFSDGMAEEILNALAQVKDLKVAGRTSSFFFKGKNEDLRAIGKTLGVANVLEGSVRKQDNKVRITAQLVQVSDGFHLWSKNFDGDLKDVFELQERIARAITDQLKVVLAGDQKTRLVSVATTSPEAYALYLQATVTFNRRDGAHFPQAIADVNEAIRLDPKFARAHARLASLYAIANTYSHAQQGESESLAAAEREANVAIELDSTLAEPHAVLGIIYEYRRQWIPSRLALERAVALDPGDTTANFWLGLAYIDSGYRRAGIASFDRALAIDPLLPNALSWRAFCYVDSGDRESARRSAQRAVDQGLPAGNLYLAALAHVEGRDDLAIEAFKRGGPQVLVGFPLESSAILAQGVFGNAAQRASAVAMIDAYVGTKPRNISAAAPWALLLLREPARALEVAQNPQTSNDALFLVWLWSSWGSAARQLPQFSAFARTMGLTELWDKYGPPDDCERKGPSDYVCH